jgi:hypothetical protein
MPKFTDLYSWLLEIKLSSMSVIAEAIRDSASEMAVGTGVAKKHVFSSLKCFQNGNSNEKSLLQYLQVLSFGNGTFLPPLLQKSHPGADPRWSQLSQNRSRRRFVA